LTARLAEAGVTRSAGQTAPCHLRLPFPAPTPAGSIVAPSCSTDRAQRVAAALDHLAWIQIDPINVCGRMQDLILRNRVAGYREGDLMRHLHGGDTVLSAEQRTAFEHHHPGSHILVAFSCSAWPYLHAEMDARSRRTGAWSGRLTPREKQLSQHILKEIETRGPLSSDAIDDDRVARKVWGQASLGQSNVAEAVLPRTRPDCRPQRQSPLL
jgi:uncharacterized protein YcaQ